MLSRSALGIAVIGFAIASPSASSGPSRQIPNEAWDALERLFVPPIGTVEYTLQGRRIMFASVSPTTQFALYEMDADSDGTYCVRFVRSGDEVFEGKPELNPGARVSAVPPPSNNSWDWYSQPKSFMEDRIRLPRLVVAGANSIDQLKDNLFESYSWTGEVYVATLWTKFRYFDSQDAPSTFRWVYDPKSKKVTYTSTTASQHPLFSYQIEYSGDVPSKFKTNEEFSTYSIITWSAEPPLGPLSPELAGGVTGSQAAVDADHPQRGTFGTFDHGTVVWSESLEEAQSVAAQVNDGSYRRAWTEFQKNRRIGVDRYAVCRADWLEFQRSQRNRASTEGTVRASAAK